MVVGHLGNHTHSCTRTHTHVFFSLVSMALLGVCSAHRLHWCGRLCSADFRATGILLGSAVGRSCTTHRHNLSGKCPRSPVPIKNSYTLSVLLLLSLRNREGLCCFSKHTLIAQWASPSFLPPSSVLVPPSSLIPKN